MVGKNTKITELVIIMSESVMMCLAIFSVCVRVLTVNIGGTRF